MENFTPRGVYYEQWSTLDNSNWITLLLPYISIQLQFKTRKTVDYDQKLQY